MGEVKRTARLVYFRDVTEGERSYELAALEGPALAKLQELEEELSSDAAHEGHEHYGVVLLAFRRREGEPAVL